MLGGRQPDSTSAICRAAVVWSSSTDSSEWNAARGLMRLMQAGKAVPFRLADGHATATIPNLHIAEVVHLELV